MPTCLIVRETTSLSGSCIPAFYHCSYLFEDAAATTHQAWDFEKVYIVQPDAGTNRKNSLITYPYRKWIVLIGEIFFQVLMKLNQVVFGKVVKRINVGHIII